MCEFASWIDYKDVSYYLTIEDLQGKTYEAYKAYNPAWITDLKGHGAIEYFYPELKGKGKHLECTDFSTPENFPADIVKSIKLGKFRGIGINLGLLNTEGKEEYKKIQQLAWKAYQKIYQPTYSEYLKIGQSAHEEYFKIEQPAWEEYQNSIQKVFWDVFGEIKYRNEAWR